MHHRKFSYSENRRTGTGRSAAEADAKSDGMAYRAWLSCEVAREPEDGSRRQTGLDDEEGAGTAITLAAGRFRGTNRFAGNRMMSRRRRFDPSGSGNCAVQRRSRPRVRRRGAEQEDEKDGRNGSRQAAHDQSVTGASLEVLEREICDLRLETCSAVPEHNHRIDAAGRAGGQIARKYRDADYSDGCSGEHERVRRLDVIEHRLQDAGQRP